MQNKIRISNGYWYAGIVAVVIYIVGVTIGGMLYPGYSHISQDVSQLVSTESPIRTFMNFAFWPYNVLVSVFGWGLYKIADARAVKAGSLSVVAIGILGFLIAFFPVNTRGTDWTTEGYIHIAIVSIVSLLTVLSGVLIWQGWKDTSYNKIAKISARTSLGFLISGPIAGIMVMSPYAGLFERVPIGIFLIWILATSVILLQSNK